MSWRNESEKWVNWQNKLERGDLDVTFTQKHLWCFPTTGHNASLSDVFEHVHHLRLVPLLGELQWPGYSEAVGTTSASKHWNVLFCAGLSTVLCPHVQTYPQREPTSSLAEPDSFALLDFSKSEHLDLTLGSATASQSTSPFLTQYDTMQHVHTVYTSPQCNRTNYSNISRNRLALNN